MVFMRFCVFTRDETNQDAPVRQAPVWEGQQGFKPYIEPCTRLWQDYAKSGIIFDKSRRMWMSYLCLTLHLHHAIRATDRRVGVMTEKFEKSDEHLKNIKRIYEAIPEDVYPQDTRPLLTYRQGLLSFDDIGSYIHGIASGPDQARQFGFSALYADEKDFWPNQRESYGAYMPTVSGGGLLTITSTHQYVDTGETSLYRQLLEDTL